MKQDDPRTQLKVIAAIGVIGITACTLMLTYPPAHMPEFSGVVYAVLIVFTIILTPIAILQIIKIRREEAG